MGITFCICKSSFRSHSVLSITTYAILIALICTTPFMLVEMSQRGWEMELNGWIIGSILYLGIVLRQVLSICGIKDLKCECWFLVLLPPAVGRSRTWVVVVRRASRLELFSRWTIDFVWCAIGNMEEWKRSLCANRFLF